MPNTNQEYQWDVIAVPTDDNAEPYVYFVQQRTTWDTIRCTDLEHANRVASERNAGTIKVKPTIGRVYWMISQARGRQYPIAGTLEHIATFDRADWKTWAAKIRKEDGSVHYSECARLYDHTPTLKSDDGIQFYWA